MEIVLEPGMGLMCNLGQPAQMIFVEVPDDDTVPAVLEVGARAGAAANVGAADAEGSGSIDSGGATSSQRIERRKSE